MPILCLDVVSIWTSPGTLPEFNMVHLEMEPCNRRFLLVSNLFWFYLFLGEFTWVKTPSLTISTCINSEALAQATCFESAAESAAKEMQKELDAKAEPWLPTNFLEEAFRIGPWYSRDNRTLKWLKTFPSVLKALGNPQQIRKALKELDGMTHAKDRHWIVTLQGSS